MPDQLNFELRLDAAVKVLAATADGPVDAAGIAAAALSGSRKTGWWRSLTSQPQTDRLPPLSIRPLLVVMLAIVAIGSIGFGIYGLRGITVGPPMATATPSPLPTESGSTPWPSVSAPTPSASNVGTIPPTWSGPVRSDAVAMPVLAMERRLCFVPGSIRWEDGLDAETRFVDIIEAGGTGGWSLMLASKPPHASQLDPRVALIEYGLIFDTDVDGTPDYELGINNSPGRGEYRVWVTNLDRGETVEQIGPPYGFPFEFTHPDEQELSDEVGMSFWFLEGSSPFPADSPFRADQRYYSWSSYSENGSVVAWDYAPDFGWLEQPACESLPAKGWPSTKQNAPGLYSWDGFTCEGQSCNVGLMHNGYGSGDVRLLIDVVAERTDMDSTNWHDVAGHGTIHRRIDDLQEEWIVDMEGPEIRIRLEAQPGTSQADLADAHAIIESMTYEPQDNDLGFRLIFTLTNDEWNSG